MFFFLNIVKKNILYQYLPLNDVYLFYYYFPDEKAPEKGALEEMRFPTLERMLAVSPA